MQHDNDLKYSTKEKNEGAAMACQSPNLNMIKMLWWDLKTAVYKQMPANLNELNHIEKKPKFLESDVRD